MPPTIVLNNFDDFLSPNGETLIVPVGEIIHFCINGTNFCPPDERHSITLESLSPSTSSGIISVTILVASTPTLYTLYLGIPLDIDVDGDGIADIRVTLESLTSKSAVINFLSLRGFGPATHLLGLLGVGG